MSADHWSAVEALFHDALSVAPAERAAFLRQRASDESLIAEVESLLSSHEDATLTKGDIDRTRWIGRRVGDYRITREIGRGGMGAIYLAVRDDDAFRKEVAVKVIKRGMDTDAIVRRFRNERQILADLDHPNIARLLDGGTTDDGLPFFVMEYIDGRQLDDFCRELSVDDRLRLFARVCEAVGYAHKRGVVHRDLKPSNILIAKNGEPKLLDFGIAKAFDTDSIDVSGTLTAAGQQVLTPAYASPEQLRGEQASPASDVYSLGVILYELLCGKRPERNDTSAPSTAASDRRLRSNVDNIVLMALRPESADRYPSARHLADDIGRHLAGEPVAAVRRRFYPVTRFMRRHTAVLAAITIAVAVSAIAFYVGRRNTPSRATQARVVNPQLIPLTTFGDVWTARISADGRTLVYSRGTLLRQSLWIRDLTTGHDRQLIEADDVAYFDPSLIGNSTEVLYPRVRSTARGRVDLLTRPAKGGEPRVLRNGAMSIYALSPDERQIVFRQRDADGRFRLLLLDRQTGRETRLLLWRPREPIGALAWSSDGRKIMFSSDHRRGNAVESSLWTLNLESRLLAETPLPGQRVVGMKMTRAGDAVVLAQVPGQNQQFWLVPANGQPPMRIAGDFSQYTTVSVDAAGESLVSIRRWAPSNIYRASLRSGAKPVALTSGDNFFGGTMLGFMPDGGVYFSGTKFGARKLLYLREGAAEPQEIALPPGASSAKVNRASRRIGYLSSRSGTDEVWTCNLDGSDEEQITRHGPIAQFDFTPDGNSVVYATHAERGIFVTERRGTRSRKLANVPAIGAVIMNPSGGSLAVSPDGRMVVSRHFTTELDQSAVVNIATGAVTLHGLSSPSAKIPLYQWLHDNSGFAIAGDTAIVVQKLTESKPREVLRLPNGHVEAFAFAPDGKSVAFAWGTETRDAVMFKNFR